MWLRIHLYKLLIIYRMDTLFFIHIQHHITINKMCWMCHKINLSFLPLLIRYLFPLFQKQAPHVPTPPTHPVVPPPQHHSYHHSPRQPAEAVPITPLSQPQTQPQQQLPIPHVPPAQPPPPQPQPQPQQQQASQPVEFNHAINYVNKIKVSLTTSISDGITLV